MFTTEDEIRDQQRSVWNQFAPGWKKWDDVTMQFLLPMGEAIIEALELNKTDHVLDVATGTGEPGLTIASIVTEGKVIGTDLSEAMLATAQEKAEHLGLDHYKTQWADADALPFPDSSFNAVSCRMGFMFFPNMVKAAHEMVRVLKPGGRLGTSVWATPDQNPWISVLIGIIGRTLQLPPPLPEAPGLFRCAKPGLIAKLLTEAGLSAVTEIPLTGVVIHESIETYWENLNEVAAPVANALKQVDEDIISQIKNEFFATFRAKYRDTQLAIPFSTLIIHGIK